MVRRRGFTLVELLVVIGIMVMLMTLVLPSFQRVRLMAKRAACGSNLRQLIIAINTYAGENKGLLPPHRLVPGTSPNPARWWGIDQESRDLGEQPYGELFVYADNPGVFHCPAILPEAAEAGAEYDWAFTAREVGYGYNAFFLGWHDGTPDPTPALAGPPDNQVLPDVRTNISFMVDASKTVVFADSAVRNTTPQDSYVTWWPSMSWSADDGSNFVVRQVFFCGGTKDEFKKWQKGLESLAKTSAKKAAEKTLKIEIDDDAFDRVYNHHSHPIPITHPGQKIAIRVISQFGEESTKVIDV